MKTLYKVINNLVETLTLQSEEEIATALADGWYKTEDEAKQAYFDKLFASDSLPEGE